jgi:hypothetical protein
MCVYIVLKKKRNNNVGKNNSIDDKLQRKKKREVKGKKDIVIFVCLQVWNMINNLIHIYHMMIFDWI